MSKVNKQKHFGHFVDSKLSFASHINDKIIKAKKGIGIIIYLSKFLPLKALHQMYKTPVRPRLYYCHMIYRVLALLS